MGCRIPPLASLLFISPSFFWLDWRPVGLPSGFAPTMTAFMVVLSLSVFFLSGGYGQHIQS
jgi:hypothetical protein